MSNLDTRIGQLRTQMEEKYHFGDKEGALRISVRLDTLIILAQRSAAGGGERVIRLKERFREDAHLLRKNT